jgi:hypothetical protein
LKEFVASAGLLSQLLRVVDKDLGLFPSKGHEFAASNPEHVVDETLKGPRARNRQVASEANAVKTREHGNDQAGKRW